MVAPVTAVMLVKSSVCSPLSTVRVKMLCPGLGSVVAAGSLLNTGSKLRLLPALSAAVSSVR